MERGSRRHGRANRAGRRRVRVRRTARGRAGKRLRGTPARPARARRTRAPAPASVRSALSALPWRNPPSSHVESRAMPIHIRAEPGDYAEAVLLPGDPLRAKYIAEMYLEDVVQR